MAKLSRKEARDILFGLLFETEFKSGENPTEIYELACKDRDIPDDKYIKDVFFGVITRSALSIRLSTDIQRAGKPTDFQESQGRLSE